MNSINIESIMTAKVAEYIAKGYILSTSTMRGHQGEVAKVDVKKGNEIIRILLTSERARDDEGTIQKTTLTVGRAQDKVHSGRPFDTMCTTIWNDRLGIIEERIWYSIDSNADCFSEDKAEIIEQHKKQTKRWRTRNALREMHIKKDITSEKAKTIVLPFIRRQNRCKRMKVEDIMKVIRFNTNKYGKMHYSIVLRNGKTYKLT